MNVDVDCQKPATEWVRLLQLSRDVFGISHILLEPDVNSSGLKRKPKIPSYSEGQYHIRSDAEEYLFAQCGRYFGTECTAEMGQPQRGSGSMKIRPLGSDERLAAAARPRSTVCPLCGCPISAVYSSPGSLPRTHREHSRANHQLHTNPARVSRFHAGHRGRRVGELKRSAELPS